jgi:hypothetical protein
VPSPEPVRTELEARRAIGDAARGRSAPRPGGGHRVGVELAWLAVPLDDPSRPVPFDALQAATASLNPLASTPA